MSNAGVIPIPFTSHRPTPGFDNDLEGNSSNMTGFTPSALSNGCARSDFNYTQHGLKCGQKEDPMVHIARMLAEVYLTIPITVLGVIGNLLSLVLLCYHRRFQKLHTILIQLQALAIVDTLILVNGLLLRSFRYIVPEHIYAGYHSVMFVYLYPTAFFLRLFGIWLTVLLTVDRYIAVWYPLDAKRLCTVRRTYLLMLAIAVGSAAFTLPRFFEYTIKTYSPGMKGFSATALTRNNVYNIVYVIVLFILLQYVIPTIVLVCLNARVIVALRRSDIHRSSIVATSSGRRSMTSLNPPDSAVVLTQSQLTPPLAPPINAIIQSTRSITVVVTAIVSLCIVVHVVALAAHIAWAVSKLSSDATTQARLEPWRRHLAQLSNVLVTLNSAVNFLIYCFFSRNFRSVLKRQFGVFNLKHFYRRTVSGSGQDDAHGCCTRYWWSRCWFGTEHRRRHRHSTGGDTGDNTGGSKRSTTLLSDSRSNGMSTRLTPIPCGVQFGENGKAHTVNGISFYGQIAAAADVVPCL